MSKIGLIGDFDVEVVAHIAIPQAIQLASDDLGCQIDVEWIPTSSLENGFEQKLAKFQALWTVPASPYKSMQGALNGIRFAREHNVPFLGTCGGFQHMIIEFARNVLALSEADHAEENPTSSLMLFAPLLEKAGMRITGVDTEGETRMMELINHPFFIGTLFQPERSAFKNIVHPLIRAFLQKVIQ